MWVCSLESILTKYKFLEKINQVFIECSNNIQKVFNVKSQEYIILTIYFMISWFSKAEWFVLNLI